jgi:hypothetical protein
VGPNNSTIPGTEVTSPDAIPGAELGEGGFRTCEVLNRPSMANLTVVKSLDPSEDPGRFNLNVNGVTELANARDTGATEPIPVPINKPAAVSETPGQQEDGTTTDLDHYDTKISCVDLAHPGQSLAHVDPGRSLKVTPTYDGQNILCTITNTSNRFGQLTVIKHLILPDDPGRFQLHIAPGSHVSVPVGDGGRLGPIRLGFDTYHVTETPAGSTNLGHYNISTMCFDQNGHEVGHNAHGPDVSVDLNEDHNQIECTITNERPGVKVGRLEVVKHLVPHDDAGTFNLLIGGKAFAVDVGHNGTTGPLEFELGTQPITEHGAEGTHLGEFSISTTCVDEAHGGHTVAHNAHGPTVSVHLNSESDNIVCTITNTRTKAPPGGGGEIPTPPGPAPHLSVVKTMPPQARVRELVPITIVVHNLGHGTAQGVQLIEKRPPGLEIVHVANGGTIQHGNAGWHLGNLAHGESRTVHATARVLHTGLHVDTAVATARNADPALSDAAVRATAAARRPRPPSPPPPVVTG